MALLVVPLAFTFFDWEQEGGEPTRDPNALLEAIRRHADRIHVFCQAGHIAVPNANRMLFNYLETSVHEVRAVREGGIFHPKVWLVRYVADQGPKKYRMLCASRNLTFDRSWDTVLVLDGVAGNRATKKNKKLSRFINSLHEMTVHALSNETKGTLVDLAGELDRVEFELPNHIDEIEFWPLGLSGKQDSWPFPKRADRGLVISPFVTEKTLKLLNIASEQTLVSRSEELDPLNPGSMEGYEIFTLSEGADLEQEQGAIPDEGVGVSTELSGGRHYLVGPSSVVATTRANPSVLPSSARSISASARSSVIPSATRNSCHSIQCRQPSSRKSARSTVTLPAFSQCRRHHSGL